MVSPIGSYVLTMQVHSLAAPLLSRTTSHTLRHRQHVDLIFWKVGQRLMQADYRLCPTIRRHLRKAPHRCWRPHLGEDKNGRVWHGVR